MSQVVVPHELVIVFALTYFRYFYFIGEVGYGEVVMI